MSCSGGDCGGSSGCCCSSIAIFDNPRSGGIHPDTIRVGAERYLWDPNSPLMQLAVPSCHLLGGTFSWHQAIAHDEAKDNWLTPLAIQLLSPSINWDGDIDNTSELQLLAAITLNHGESFVLGDEYTGLFCDGGIFIHAVTGRDPGTIYPGHVTCNVVFVERPLYTPAFNEVDNVLQHYWGCWRDDALYHNWYSGQNNVEWGDETSTPNVWTYNTIDPPFNSLAYDNFLQDESGATMHVETGQKLAFEPETIGNS